jgi:hypothetical protein
MRTRRHTCTHTYVHAHSGDALSVRDIEALTKFLTDIKLERCALTHTHTHTHAHTHTHTHTVN